MCAYSVFNTFPVYPLSAKPLILLAFCRYRYHTSLFERPVFRRMLDLIEDGKIGVITTKDLSRLGRNYIEVGSYTEIYFPKNNVRYIAVNDNFDSMYTDGNELAPFKNLFNEWFARDTSKKIRAVKRAKTVADILSREDYIGNTVNCRFTVASYKDKRKMKRDPSEHIRFEHTHEPIIDMQTWETVQKLSHGKRRPTSTGETSKYSGLLFCADCGSKLYFNHKRADDPKSYSFNCSHYRNNAKDKCTPHRIREVVLDEILLEELRRITYTARTRERQFAEFINKKSSSENRRELNAKQREYERLSKRTAELNALFKRLYEDNVLGRINNEQFRMLSCGYTDEQKSIYAKLPLPIGSHL